jgi:adenylosuccinate lyase
MTKGQIFAEFVLDALIKKGVPRLIAYRDIQRVAFAASDAETEFLDAVKNDAAISAHLNTKEIEAIFVPENHLGAADKIINNVYRKVLKTCSKFT